MFATAPSRPGRYDIMRPSGAESKSLPTSESGFAMRPRFTDSGRSIDFARKARCSADIEPASCACVAR
jgi:hypothetical protein